MSFLWIDEIIPNSYISVKNYHGIETGTIVAGHLEEKIHLGMNFGMRFLIPP